MCFLVFGFRLMRTDVAQLGFFVVPFLATQVGGLSLVLLSWIARAVFDIASARK